MHTDEMRPQRRVLFLSYMFPPLGGPGVQRNLKYAKYLPEFGWTSSVVTVKDITYYVYDESLLAELDHRTTISRTESIDPFRLSRMIIPVKKQNDSNTKGVVHHPVFKQNGLMVRVYQRLRDVLAFPDATTGWIPFAYRKGLELIRKQKIDVILAGYNTVSNVLTAYMLWKATGIPYVLDFRDGWTDDPALPCPTRLHRWGHALLERKVVGNASAVTVYGDFLAGRFVERYPWLNGRVHTLPNGFDPNDLEHAAPVQRFPGKHRIVYMGSLYAHHEPNFQALLEAVKQLPEGLKDHLEILFVGQAFAGAHEMVRAVGLDKQITFVGYLSHGEALGYLASADAGLLFVKPGDTTMVTGKVFEYLMVGRPIIACVAADGACADVLRQAGHDRWITPPADSQCLTKVLCVLAKEGWPSPNANGADQFDRKKNTQRLATILDHVAAEPGRQHI